MWKKVRFIILGLAVLILALLCVLLVRTAGFTSRQMPQGSVPPANDFSVDRDVIAQHLAEAVQFQTISYQDPARFDEEVFLALHIHLEQTFPRVHSALIKEIIGNFSLLYTWKGRSEELKPILLMAHTDVVPIEPGTEENWDYPPFAGQIAEGFIWGRGAMDDKASVLGILEAVELLLEQGFQPERTVLLAFGHDEEAGGMDGASKIASLLRSRNVEPEYIIDEGLVIIEGMLSNVSEPVALVGVAEKGYLNVELSVEHRGGHSAMPPRHTSIGILSTAIHRLEQNPLPMRIQGPIKEMFDYTGPEMPMLTRMIFANLWLFRGLVKKQLAKSPETAVQCSTTTAVTMIEGGVKENVIPTQAKALVNFRILPGDTVQSIVEHVRKAIDNPQVKINPSERYLEPSPVSDSDSESFKIIHQTIRQIFPDVLVSPGLMIAGTDTKHYVPLTNNIYRFLPFRATSEDIARAHGTNERMSVENYEQIVKFYAQLILNSTK